MGDYHGCDNKWLYGHILWLKGPKGQLLKKKNPFRIILKHCNLGVLVYSKVTYCVDWLPHRFVDWLPHRFLQNYTSWLHMVFTIGFSPDRSGVYLQCHAVYAADPLQHTQCTFCLTRAPFWAIMTALYPADTLKLYCLYTPLRSGSNY